MVHGLWFGIDDHFIPDVRRCVEAKDVISRGVEVNLGVGVGWAAYELHIFRRRCVERMRFVNHLPNRIEAWSGWIVIRLGNRAVEIEILAHTGGCVITSVNGTGGIRCRHIVQPPVVRSAAIVANGDVEFLTGGRVESKVENLPIRSRAQSRLHQSSA